MQRAIETRARRAVVRGRAAGDRGGAGRRVLLRRGAHRERAAAGPALLPPLGGQRADRRAGSPRTSRSAEPLHHFNTVEFPTFDLRGELRTIEAPTLVVVGDDDMIAGPVCAEAILRELVRRAARDDRRLGPLRLRRAARRVPRRPDRLPPVTEDAVAALRAGRAVILPTDTVYGLCALPEHEDVLYELKGRDRSKPVALLAADVDALVAAVPGLDRSVLERYLPGPYTLVFGKVGVRVPEPAAGQRPRSSARSASSRRRARTSPAGRTRAASRTSRRRSAPRAARSSTPASSPASRPR